jgi:hypothetical protein
MDERVGAQELTHQRFKWLVAEDPANDLCGLLAVVQGRNDLGRRSLPLLEMARANV